MLTIVSLTSSFLINEEVACIEDRLFDATEDLNKYFGDHPEVRNAYMIVCGLFMDIMVLTQFYRWTRYGTTWRLPMCMFGFYSFRSIV